MNWIKIKIYKWAKSFYKNNKEAYKRDNWAKWRKKHGPLEKQPGPFPPPFGAVGLLEVLKKTQGDVRVYRSDEGDPVVSFTPSCQSEAETDEFKVIREFDTNPNRE